MTKFLNNIYQLVDINPQKLLSNHLFKMSILHASIGNNTGYILMQQEDQSYIIYNSRGMKKTLFETKDLNEAKNKINKIISVSNTKHIRYIS